MGTRLLAAIAAFFASFGSIAAAASLEAYTRLPAMQDVRLSEDGQNVAYISSRGGQLRVVVQQLSDGAALAVLDLGDNKIRSVEWASPDYVVVTVSSTTSIQHVTFVGELYQAISLNVRTGAAVQLMQRARGLTGY